MRLAQSMSNLSAPRPNGRRTPSEVQDGPSTFPTLKKSLSASSSVGNQPNRSPNPVKPRGEARKRIEAQDSLSVTDPPSLFVDIPKMPVAAEAALTALQYLPTPLLVLSSLKTVMLANEAMGRLLGLDLLEEDNDTEDTSQDNESVLEKLRGQSLSQLGIDLVQDGQQIWVSWEVSNTSMRMEMRSKPDTLNQKFLDSLADEFDVNKHHDVAERQTKAFGTSNNEQDRAVDSSTKPLRRSDAYRRGKKIASSRTKSRALVHDAVVNVLISSQYIEAGNMSSSRSTKSSASDNQIQAKMITSIWTLDNQRYFTLTFTSNSGAAISPPRTHSRTVSRTPTQGGPSPSSYSNPSSPISPNFCPHCGSAPSLIVGSPPAQPLSISPFPPLGPPNKTDLTAPPAVLKKLSRMKDAMVDAIEIPLFAMWKDESLALPNKAISKMMYQRADPISDDAYDLLSRFKCYTEDFETELDPEDYPITKLCRTQEPFSKWKIGILDSKSRRKVYECSGEGIYDDKTREFLGGMVALKDVTEYTDLIKTQHEENEQQFELICETLPQMVSKKCVSEDPD